MSGDRFCSPLQVFLYSSKPVLSDFAKNCCWRDLKNRDTGLNSGGPGFGNWGGSNGKVCALCKNDIYEKYSFRALRTTVALDDVKMYGKRSYELFLIYFVLTIIGSSWNAKWWSLFDLLFSVSWHRLCIFAIFCDNCDLISRNSMHFSATKALMFLDTLISHR